MIKYRIAWSSLFKRSAKKLSKKDYQKMTEVIDTLLIKETLPKQYKNHKLSGNLKDYQECHIKPDLLLIYRYIDDELELYLFNIGSHSDLF